MSAWAEIVNADGSDEWLQKCELAMQEVQDVTLHRAAEKIRYAGGFRLAFSEHLRGMAAAADLIDPETGS